MPHAKLLTRLRVSACILFVCLASNSDAHPSEKVEPLRKACDYLWSQQADDGGWHSQQYAVMRSGQALTPFVLHTLIHVPDSIYPRPEDKAKKGLKFIRDHIEQYGHMGHADPDVVEYPVYSTAYAMRCLLEAPDSFLWDVVIERDGVPMRIQTWEQKAGVLVDRMERFIVKAQFSEGNGFTKDSPAFGGWGFDAPRRPGDPGHMDLAHTRRALDALTSLHDRFRIHGRSDPGRQAVFKRARRFLKLVQKHPDAIRLQPHYSNEPMPSSTERFDGGFYFSPVVLAANKGREELEDAKSFRSYATATCDGILALLAAGVHREDERIARAVEWLSKHDDLTYPQGVPTDHPEPWGEAIRYYHYAVRAEAYAALDWPGDWRAELSSIVAKNQAADGSFRNTASPLMKEDDPLLCTALATIALTQCANGEWE
jgi:squalene-hopene/tetraprenyl-beta-curcumene cyclase